MKDKEVTDIEKEIKEKVESVVKEKLTNLFMSASSFNDIKWLIENNLRQTQDNIQSEIRSALGSQLNEASKQLSYIVSPKIVNRVNEFENQICNLLKDHTESIAKFQQETLNKFRSEVSPISNLYIMNEKINVKKRLNAEDYVKSKLERQGFRVVKQTCDPGVPDFAIYKEVGKDKNLLEMDAYDMIKKEASMGIQKKDMMQKTWDIDIELPVYSEQPLFIEVKTNGDGLRMNQLEWIKNHPENKVIVYCIEQIISEP